MTIEKNLLKIKKFAIHSHSQSSDFLTVTKGSCNEKVHEHILLPEHFRSLSSSKASKIQVLWPHLARFLVATFCFFQHVTPFIPLKLTSQHGISFFFLPRKDVFSRNLLLSDMLIFIKTRWTFFSYSLTSHSTA